MNPILLGGRTLADYDKSIIDLESFSFRANVVSLSHHYLRSRLCWTLLAVLFCSCSDSNLPAPNNPKPVFPVTGIVVIDGQPAADVKVQCVPFDGVDKENPTSSMAFTNERGEFRILTYYDGDGAPEGEFALTFLWGKRQFVDGKYAGPDKLNGRYSDPKASEVRFVVLPGRITELEEIQLTTE